jgi:hypothetical protein
MPVVRILFFFILFSFAKYSSAIDTARIQVALIIDVSTSMNGLIDQAKSQFWNISNQLQTLQKKNHAVQLEFALATVGNAAYYEDYSVFLHNGFVSDADSVFENLLSLKTSGSDENFGFAIQVFLKHLKWSVKKSDLRLIFVAGNEEFNQGPVPYLGIIHDAAKKGIIVNTIFCGQHQQGIELLWKSAAREGKGEYHAIFQDSVSPAISTPFDAKLRELNNQLNTTYVPFGQEGNLQLERMVRFDQHAEMLGGMMLCNRLQFKCNASFFHPAWDYIDACRDNPEFIKQSSDLELPPLLKGMNEEERMTFVRKKSEQRGMYRDAIQTYTERMKEFFPAQSNRLLHEVMWMTILDQARKKGFTEK